MQASLRWSVEPRQLLDKITSEVEGILTTLPVAIVSRSSSLLGAIIDMQLSDIDQSDLGRIQCQAETRQAVIAARREKACLYLSIGYDNWTTTWTDPLTGSQVWSMDHDVPLSSPKRTQIVRLSMASSFRSSFVRGHQELVWFLKASLRLNVFDVSDIIEHLQGNPAWAEWPVIDWNEVSELPASGSLMHAAYDCIQHPLLCGYGEELQTALYDTNALKALNASHPLSHVERDAKGCYFVVVAAKRFDGAVSRMCHQKSPSFFVHFDLSANCKPQVHVLEGTIAKRKTNS